MTAVRRASVVWAMVLSSAALAAEPGTPVSRPLDLAACRRLAREKQPALAAYRAAVAKAEAGVVALDNLVFAELIQKDLPYRRRQAAHGLTIARLQLSLGEAETTYAVTRTYLTALLALEQKRLAADGVKSLTDVRAKLANIKGGLEDPRARRLDVLLELANGRAAEAESGFSRAVAALAEAIGLESPDGLAIVGGGLPDLRPALDPRQVFELSLRHRPELMMSVEFAAGAALEVAAQAEAKGLTVQTFAAGADLHSEPLPPGPTDTEYRPKPLGPEMPTVLTGCREDRVAQARALSARSAALVAKTRNLASLEARNALLRWEELTARLAHSGKAADLADALAKKQTQDFIDVGPVPGDVDFGTALASVIEGGLLATAARLEANQVRFDRLLLLALLEKITAGTFAPGFDGPCP